MHRFSKVDGEVLDFAIDYTKELTDKGSDTISTSTWSVPTGLVLDSDQNTTLIATAFLSGGTVGKEYEVVNEITTAAGRTYQRRMTIVILKAKPVHGKV